MEEFGKDDFVQYLVDLSGTDLDSDSKEILISNLQEYDFNELLKSKDDTDKKIVLNVLKLVGQDKISVKNLNLDLKNLGSFVDELLEKPESKSDTDKKIVLNVLKLVGQVGQDEIKSEDLGLNLESASKNKLKTLYELWNRKYYGEKKDYNVCNGIKKLFNSINLENMKSSNRQGIMYLADIRKQLHDNDLINEDQYVVLNEYVEYRNLHSYDYCINLLNNAEELRLNQCGISNIFESFYLLSEVEVTHIAEKLVEKFISLDINLSKEQIETLRRYNFFEDDAKIASSMVKEMNDCGEMYNQERVIKPGSASQYHNKMKYSMTAERLDFIFNANSALLNSLAELPLSQITKDTLLKMNKNTFNALVKSKGKYLSDEAKAAFTKCIYSQYLGWAASFGDNDKSKFKFKVGAIVVSILLILPALGLGLSSIFGLFKEVKQSNYTNKDNKGFVDPNLNQEQPNGH